jgi:hypothetical protein
MPLVAPIPVVLAIDERLALRRFASERDIRIEDAAAIVIREYLIAGGWLEVDEDEPESAA